VSDAPRASTARASVERIGADDRALVYGDALFETLLCINGRALWSELHRERLELGLRRLAFPADNGDFAAALARGERQAGAYPAAVLRISVSRGSGPRGYAPPAQQQPQWRVSVYPIDGPAMQAAPPAVLVTWPHALAEQPLLAGIKHSNRLEQVLGAAHARRCGVDDVVMCDARGNLQCTSSANLFAVVDDQLLTAPCDRCGVAGTRRRLVLETLAPALGLATRVRTMAARELTDAPLFMSNSVAGLRAVASVDGRARPTSAVFQRLQAAYREAMRACAEK
jgi:4-amino-4-deoxychorismate lyase